MGMNDITELVKVIENKETLKSSLRNGCDVFMVVTMNYISYRKGEEEICVADNLAESICYALTKNDKSDPIWDTTSKSLLKSVVFYLIESAYDFYEQTGDTNRLASVTPLAIYNFIKHFGGNDELNEILKNSPYPLSKRAYEVSNFDNKELRTSIYCTLVDRISVFKESSLGCDYPLLSD